MKQEPCMRSSLWIKFSSASSRMLPRVLFPKKVSMNLTRRIGRLRPFKPSRIVLFTWLFVTNKSWKQPLKLIVSRTGISWRRYCISCMYWFDCAGRRSNVSSLMWRLRAKNSERASKSVKGCSCTSTRSDSTFGGKIKLRGASTLRCHIRQISLTLRAVKKLVICSPSSNRSFAFL